MSIRSQFLTDPKRNNEGVWFKYQPNPDGSIPAFHLARFGRANKRWLVAFRENTKDIDVDNLTPEEDFELSLKTFCQSVLHGWENFQPEEDGNAIPFSIETAIDILSKPEWADFYGDLTAKAGTKTHFKMRDTEAKN